MSVLFVCLCLSTSISGNARPIFAVTRRKLVLFWRRCDTLCTSGFMDDVIHDGNEQE